MQRKIEELERKQKVAKSPSSSSTVKMKTASRGQHRSTHPNEYSDVDVTAQCSSNGGSILAVSSPGTIAKQREMPGAVDLTELRRLYSYDENMEYY